jgi:hypothetical protein
MNDPAHEQGFLLTGRGCIVQWIRKFRLLSIAFTCAAICLPAIQSTSAADAQLPLESTEKITLRVGGGWRTYVSYFGRLWEPYPFGGLTLDLPTASPRFFFRTSFDAGRASARPPSTMNLLTLRESFTGITELFLAGPMWVRAGVGVSSATFFFSEEFEVSDKLFNTSESEFGLVSCLEAVYRYKKWEVTVPVLFDCIFSLPHSLLMLSLGIQAGGAF